MRQVLTIYVLYWYKSTNTDAEDALLGQFAAHRGRGLFLKNLSFCPPDERLGTFVLGSKYFCTSKASSFAAHRGRGLFGKKKTPLLMPARARLGAQVTLLY